MKVDSLKFINNKSDTLDILLHGSKGGMDYPLMGKIFEECIKQGHSVANFNFPYFERGEEQSSGLELKEELEALRFVLDQCNANEYKQIRLIGKSLGAIVASYFLKSLPKEKQPKYSVIVFGYVTESIDLKIFEGKTDIIQGENDVFGSVEVVKNDLKDAVSNKINYFEIKNADHSYRNELKEPVFEDEAIEVFRRIK